MLLQEQEGQTKQFIIEGEARQVTYLTRIDPFSGNVSKISVERARRSVGISVELQITSVENCAFCDYKICTPREHIEHACGAVTVPNLYPWERYDWITIYPPFSSHKLLLSELDVSDIERMLESSYDLATICADDPEVIAFMDFTNWGAFAGASQQHPHSQRKSITRVPSPVVQNELERCSYLSQQYRQNPFALLEQEELAAGRRVIHDDGIFIGAMFAPTCPDEILVFPKDDISHILQTTELERKRIAQSLISIFPALFFCRGVTSLNIAMHMAPYSEIDEARKYYRWHMHIYPRRARLPVDRAGAEIGFGTQVIDTMPETTAEVLRRWYVEGPMKELIAKTKDGQTNSGLLNEFSRVTTRCLQ